MSVARSSGERLELAALRKRFADSHMGPIRLAGDMKPGKTQAHRPPAPRRQDIQALRALAVVAVVAYHADLPISGGFLGVDIFFVVSGYVIAALLLREFVSTGQINLRNFYSRRIMRLLPALLTLVVVVLLISLAVFPVFRPLQTSFFTGFAGIFSLANVVIATTTFDYFAAPARENIFLHLWSLSVEEQFYLIFPALLLLLLARSGLGRRTFFVLIGITVFSFGLAVFGSSEFRAILPFGQSVVGFYSPVSRGWEFAVGAAIAFLPPGQLSEVMRKLALGIGIALVVSSLVFLSDDFRSPGVTTLLPVLGTALVILAGWRSSSRAPQWILFLGNISYSWYLWHWPTIVLSEIIWPSNEGVTIVAAVFSIVPATASYFLVEQPLRYGLGGKKVGPFRLLVVTLPVAMAVGAIVPAFYSFVVEPNSNRFQLLGDFEEDEYYSHLTAIGFECPKIVACVGSKPGADHTVVILGNSHGAHLFVGLAEQLPNENVAWLTGSAELYKNHNPPPEKIRAFLDLESVHTLVIGEYWTIPSQGDFPIGLEDLVRKAEQAQVSVVIPNGTPHIEYPVFRCKWGLAMNPNDKACRFPSSQTLRTATEYLEPLKTLDDSYRHVLIATTLQTFCPDDFCYVGDQDSIFFRDNNHLGIYGSRTAAPPIIDAISTLRQLDWQRSPSSLSWQESLD